MSAGTGDARFPGDGDLYALVRATDWSRTPLGPLDRWPATLTGYTRMIFEMPSPAIIFWGPDQTQIYNAGYATIMGPRHPEYFGRPYRESWPDTYPTIYPWMRQVLDEGQVIEVENEHIPLTRYGFEEEAYFTFTFSPLRDHEGTIQGIFQPVFEVTDGVLGARRAELLRALETRTGLSERLQDSVDVLAGNPWDIPFALFYLWNDSTGTLELAGWTHAPGDEASWAALARRAFQSNSPVEVSDADDLPGAIHAGPWPEPVRSALILPIARSGPDAPRGVAAFGLSSRLHFDEKYRNFLELTAGQVVARVALAMERSARRRQVERQRQYLRDLFTQAPAAIAVVRGPDHVFELSNPLYQRLIGEDRDVVGKPARDALPELESQSFFEVLDDVYRSGEAVVRPEVPARLDRNGDGEEEGFYSLVYQPMHDSSGSVEGILLFAFDMTEQVRARQRVESLMEELKLEHRRKDEFLAMLAHELRNPLAAIRNAVAVLASSPATRETDARHCLEILERQARTLTSIVDDLLDVSRITRGLVNLNLDRLDLARVVERAFESVQPLMDEKDHQVDVAVPAEPVPVKGDGVRLEQILVNLLTNAAKYTDPGGDIRVSLERRDDEALLRVRDSGIGLEPEAMENIFSLFGQADRGLARSEGGLGIGLTVVRNLVELHGGRIQVRSEGLGNGSEFLVTLPLASLGELATGTEPAEPAGASPVRRVLVVDDNEDAAQTLALLLKSEGHAVTVAPDGPSALARADEHPPDVVLLDIGLPGMDGYEVARHLRENRRTRAARIAAMTGYGQPGDRARTLAAGFDDHLVKPVDVEVLAAFVNATPTAPSGGPA